VEVCHFGISRIGCRELRDARTTPERDTRPTPERDTRTTPERDTRTTSERYTATTPDRDTRTTPETHRRRPGTYRRADATRSGPGLHVCGPHAGHRRPFSLRYESLPARVKAKGSDRCLVKARAALTGLHDEVRAAFVEAHIALLGNAGKDFSVAVAFKYPASRNHLVEDRQAGCISVIRCPTHSVVIESI
jgi:hypothetical protein